MTKMIKSIPIGFIINSYLKNGELCRVCEQKGVTAIVSGVSLRDDGLDMCLLRNLHINVLSRFCMLLDNESVH
jgi:hypothetical protein